MTGRRRAILIGNDTFPHDPSLQDLRCPLNDVAGLAEQLERRDRGGFDEVIRIENSESGSAKRALVSFLRTDAPNDTALIYFSGHGKLDDSFELHLCTKDTETPLLEATSISSDFIWDLLRKSSIARSVVILDCCYSGAAGRIKKGAATEGLRSHADGVGAYLLTAADAIETAQEKEGDRYGVFTKHLIAGIETGDADLDGDGIITMDSLYQYVSRRIGVDSPQTPTRETGGHGEILIAKSGRDPRRDRLAAARRLLYAKVAEDALGDAIAKLAVDAAAKRPSELSEAERVIDDALTKLLTGEIGLGVFGDAVHAASSKITDRPPAKNIAPEDPSAWPKTPPPADSSEKAAEEGATNARPEGRPPGGRESEAPPHSSPLAPDATATKLADRPSPMLDYGVPALAFATLPVLAGATMGNGLIPGLVAAAIIGVALNGKWAKRSLGGKIANIFVLAFASLAILAGLAG